MSHRNKVNNSNNNNNNLMDNDEDDSSSSRDHTKPSFSGGFQPAQMGISLHSVDDDLDEEPSRRVAGVSFASVGAADAVRSMPRGVAMPPSSSPFMNTWAPKQQLVVSSGYAKASPSTSQYHQPAATASSAGAGAGAGWELREAPTLPAFHPLERTAAFVPHQTTCYSVASRIAQVLRDRSIEAEYDNEKAKIKCRTPDGVDFRVRLYRGRDNHAHGIIVEVQRRFGTSLRFYHDTTAILDVAQGKDLSQSSTCPPPPPSLGSADLPMVSDDSESEGDDASSSYQADPTSSLRMVEAMLRHPGYDSQYLAYQTLVPLTSSSKVGMKTARAVSMELLRPGNPVGTQVLNLVLQDGGSQNASGIERSTLVNNDDPYQLRTWALTVIANALTVTRGEPLERCDVALAERLTNALLRDLYRAEHHPRNAQLASAICEFLIVRANAKTTATISDFSNALEQARLAGEARHEGLRQQASRTLDVLATTRRSGSGAIP